MFYKSKPDRRGVVQLVEHRSPKPSVVGSNPATPANRKPCFFLQGMPIKEKEV